MDNLVSKRVISDGLSCYFKAIKRTQPHGPYAMLGYCWGDVIAFELAKRLEALGDKVSFVVVSITLRI